MPLRGANELHIYALGLNLQQRPFIKVHCEIKDEYIDTWIEYAIKAFLKNTL